MPRLVARCTRWRISRKLLEVGREADVGDAARAECRATGEVADVCDVRRIHHPAVVDGDILEDTRQVDVLLGEGVDQVAVVMARDGKDGSAIELRVVQAVGQVQPTRTGRGEAHTETSGELRVGSGSEGGRL